MFDCLRFTPLKLNIFSTISCALIILVIIIFSDSIISNGRLHLYASESGKILHNQLQNHQTKLKITSGEDDEVNMEKNVQPKNKLRPQELELFVTSNLGKRFDSRVREFWGRNQCKVQIFMTWISPVELFGEREFFGLESLFQTNPKSCLIILSRTMDTQEGHKILDPLINFGFSVEAITPDLWALLKNSPAENWYNEIKNGKKDPGEIPLPQNLSNLIRLAVLYKYGGVYLDTDFIFLRDFSGLRNSIGAQSVDVNGNWTRLNNAVLVFDKNHPLVGKFIEEFAFSFDGNRWGHNGPYLVSRVAKGEKFFNFTVLPPMAFYPVDWTRVGGFFVRPNNQVGSRWARAKIRQLSQMSYGVHLWNSQSSRFKIEEGSILGRLISDHCVICRRNSSSSSRGRA